MFGLRFGRVALLLFLILALVAGCGKKKGSVSGTVSYKGQKLERGVVVFYGVDGVAKSSPIHTDGTYAVEGLFVGPATITVTSTPDIGNDQTKSALDPPGKYIAIPEKYGNRERSGLICEIKSGPQTLPIELTN